MLRRIIWLKQVSGTPPVVGGPSSPAAHVTSMLSDAYNYSSLFHPSTPRRHRWGPKPSYGLSHMFAKALNVPESKIYQSPSLIHLPCMNIVQHQVHKGGKHAHIFVGLTIIWHDARSRRERI